MQIGARFGGHIVSGHIDFVSKFMDKKEVGNSIFLTFEISHLSIKVLTLLSSEVIHKIKKNIL